MKVRAESEAESQNTLALLLVVCLLKSQCLCLSSFTISRFVRNQYNNSFNMLHKLNKKCNVLLTFGIAVNLEGIFMNCYLFYWEI